MLKLAGGVIAGVAGWAVLATIINLGLRHGWPAYATVEKSMLFTPPMLVARLTMSAVASLASGFLAARIAPGRPSALISGGVLLLLFLPVHYTLWAKFPLWYHLTFLASLPILAWIGGRFANPVALSD